jgi:hypothetical protein
MQDRSHRGQGRASPALPRLHQGHGDHPWP